jgi:hypothetical protein
MPADLDRARRYLNPQVEPASPRMGIAWHAWPAALLLLVLAIVAWIAKVDPPALAGPPDFGRAMQAFDWMNEVILCQIIFGFLALGHIVLNVAAFLFDRQRPFALKLADVTSILIPLVLIVLILASPMPLTPVSMHLPS